jgi:hypothetical protein
MQQVAALLNHLVGAGKKRWRNVEAERLGGGQVDNEIELGRLLDRQVGGFRSAQNPVDIVGRAPVEVREVRSVGHQSPGFDVGTSIEDGWQVRGERERDDARAVGGNECPHLESHICLDT